MTHLHMCVHFHFPQNHYDWFLYLNLRFVNLLHMLSVNMHFIHISQKGEAICKGVITAKPLSVLTQDMTNYLSAFS